MSFSERLKDTLWNFKKSRSAKITVLVLLLLVVASAAGYVLFDGGGVATVATNENTNTAEATEQNVRRRIDGVLVPASRANAFPEAVVIENLMASRPQAGLDQANIVYEALAEGGITRFLAVFASGENVEKIGPVRSARMNHLDVVRELGALFVHAGGSPAALAALPDSGIHDFNQFFNGQYFDRDKERLKTHAREHTLYTTSVLLARALRDEKLPEQGDFEPWLFADDAPIDERPTEAKTIDIDFSSFSYKVGYAYKRDTNTYERSQAELPHVMENGKTISAKNVIVQYVPTRVADDVGRLDMDLVGEGEALVFSNGEAQVATWKKSSRDARTRYYDDAGKEMIFVAGNIWVEILPADRDVSYT